MTITSYTVEDLDADTEYTFVVSSLRNGREVKSEAISVKTLPESTESIADFEASFKVYPNPVNDKLYIETEVEVEELVVYDVYGRHQVTETPGLQGSSVIDLTNLNSGVYFVKLVTNEGEVVKRIVKN